MKRVTASANAKLTAPPERALAVLRAIERYPDWHPDVVRDVQLLDRGQRGSPTTAFARLRVMLGPVVREVEMTLAVRSPTAGQIELTRLPNEPTDPEEFELRWLVEEGSVSVTINAYLDVPRLLPLGRLGDELAEGFVTALRRELGSPLTAPPRAG